MRNLELKLPPPVVALITACLMWLLSRLAGSFALPQYLRVVLGTALVVGGFAIARSGLLAFRRANTTSDPTRPGTSSSLVRSGVYRFSRNPMYLGVLLVLVGWAVFLANLLAFVVLPAFVLYLNRFQIAPEERALTSRFGADFAVYKTRVRRWL